MSFPTMHYTEVRRVVEWKVCQECGNSFYRTRGSETISCCKRLVKQPKRFDRNAYWKEQTTFHLRSMQ